MKILIDGQTFETPEIHRGIGVYVKNVIENMLKVNFQHEWYITISERCHLNELSRWVQNKIHIIEGREFIPGTDYARNVEYTDKISEIIRSEHIDVFWIPNALMVNVLFLDRMVNCSIYVTIFDLIPYIYPVSEWKKFITQEYLRRIQFLKDREEIGKLFISNSAKEDYRDLVCANIKGGVTPLAADHKLFYNNSVEIKNADRENPYIMFTGGFDYRKNIDGAIEAFEIASEKYKKDIFFSKFKLIIVGAYNQEIKEKYDDIVIKKGLEGKVEFTGYVNDNKLADLYRKADIFFFPSLYEGFGLPILEAMLSGAYVVSANNSSLPEVCGDFALLGDAQDTGQMADLLYQAYLNRKKESLEDVKRRQEYARTFSWERTALKTLSILEKDKIKKFDGKKKNIAVVTPWPEQETGIANFVYKQVSYIAEFYNIDVYTDAEPEKIKEPNKKNIKIFPLTLFELNHDKYFRVLYEIGNNVEFHRDIFELSEKYPDVAEIHDFVLTHFFYHSYYLNGYREKFAELMERAYQLDGIKEFERMKRTNVLPDEWKYPMCEAIVKNAKNTIFHNHWSKNHVNIPSVEVIPLSCFDKEKTSQQEKEQLTKKIKTKINYSDEWIIGCFGWVNENKRPKVVVNAINEVIAQGKKVKLIFWGKSNYAALEDYVKINNLQDKVIVTGFLDKTEYEIALELTDIVINLRYPSMGESSGTLCDAFRYGKPVIVSDVNQYSEYPDEICWKLPVGRNEVELLKNYITCLIERDDVRKALSHNAQNYAEYVLSPEKIAYQYYCFLENKEK